MENNFKPWCEEYKDYYRNIHPKYCDMLADLLELPVGTKFFVTDGCWYGEILQNDFVFIHSIFGTWAIKISPEHHSLYLELENKTL